MGSVIYAKNPRSKFNPMVVLPKNVVVKPLVSAKITAKINFYTKMLWSLEMNVVGKDSCTKFAF